MSHQMLVLCAAFAAAWAVVLGWPAHRMGIPRRARPLSALRERLAAAVQARRAPPIAELLSALAAELSAGQPTGPALVTAASDLERNPCPQAAVAVRTGGDVAEALRADAAAAGGPALRGLAACWEVAERSGAGLAVAVTQLAEGVRASAEAEAALSAELAAVRTSARILAALPLLGLLIGQWIGAQPLVWLTGSWLGRGVLVAGVGLQLAGMAWLHRMVSRTRAGL
jgi:tight adherence protein B